MGKLKMKIIEVERECGIKMKKKAKTVKVVNEKTINFINDHYSKFNFGINESVERFIDIYNICLWQIKGQFSENELKAIVDVVQGVNITSAWITNNVLLDLIQEDYQSGQLEKWDINAKKLYGSINTLDALDAFFLAIWARNFWKNGVERDLDDYIKKLL